VVVAAGGGLLKNTVAVLILFLNNFNAGRAVNYKKI